RLELRQHVHEAADVRVVEWRVHLVEETERAGLREEDAEEEGQRDERALTTREQVNALRAFAARRRVNLDVAVEWRGGILQTHVALAAAEQRHEDLAEVLADLRERGQKELARRVVDLADGLLERLLGRGEIGALGRQEFLTLERFLMLLDGQYVHGTEL